MTLARAVRRSSESTGLLPPRVRSPPAQPVSTRSQNGSVAVVECRRSEPARLEPRYERDCTDEQSGAASSLPSIAPTSRPSGRPCSRCVRGTSSATLLLLTQLSVCCIDRLNPPPQAVILWGFERSALDSSGTTCIGQCATCYFVADS